MSRKTGGWMACVRELVLARHPRDARERYSCTRFEFTNLPYVGRDQSEVTVYVFDRWSSEVRTIWPWITWVADFSRMV